MDKEIMFDGFSVHAREFITIDNKKYAFNGAYKPYELKGAIKTHTLLRSNGIFKSYRTKKLGHGITAFYILK